MYAKPMPPEIEKKWIELLGDPTKEQIDRIKIARENRKILEKKRCDIEG